MQPKTIEIAPFDKKNELNNEDGDPKSEILDSLDDIERDIANDKRKKEEKEKAEKEAKEKA